MSQYPGADPLRLTGCCLHSLTRRGGEAVVKTHPQWLLFCFSGDHPMWVKQAYASTFLMVFICLYPVIPSMLGIFGIVYHCVKASVFLTSCCHWKSISALHEGLIDPPSGLAIAAGRRLGELQAIF